MHTLLKMIQRLVDDNNLVDKLDYGLENYNPELWQFVSSVHQQIAKPIGSALLAFFLMIEFSRIYKKMDGNSFSLQAFLPIAIKILMAGTVMAYLPQILQGIMGLGAEIVIRIQALLHFDRSFNLFDTKKVEESIKALKFREKIFGNVALIISWLIMQVASLMARVTIAMRFIELYVLTALGAIPAATIPCEELSNVATNYFKTYASVVIEGVVLYIVLSFFPVLCVSLINKNTGDGFFSMTANLIAFSLALIVSTRQAGKWAKAITGAI